MNHIPTAYLSNDGKRAIAQRSQEIRRELAGLREIRKVEQAHAQISDGMRNTLIRVSLKRREKRFTGDGPTGFGEL